MAGHSKRLLLIVDDDVDTRELLTEAFSEEFRVIAVGDAVAALREVKREHPHVVLTDESLPGMRGADLAKAIKASAPETRVILFSGHMNIPGTEGADRVLRKPLDLPELSDALTDHPR